MVRGLEWKKQNKKMCVKDTGCGVCVLFVCVCVYKGCGGVLVASVALVPFAATKGGHSMTEAASKAQTIAATHALHAFSTPTGRE